MQEVIFPYGKRKLSHCFEDGELAGVLTSSIEHYEPACSEAELIRNAMSVPVGSQRLCDLAQNKKKVQ